MHRTTAQKVNYMINITATDIQTLLDQKLITVKASICNPELSVVKYSRKVFYDNLWHKHPMLKYCRGMVIDADCNVVVMPFVKVHNRNETPDSDFPADDDVLIVRKVNGFLGVVTYTKKHGWIYSTTGSLDSDFVGYIKDHVNPTRNRIKPVEGATYLFEIVHEKDPHIVRETVGAYLIGLREQNGEMVDELTLDCVVQSMYGIRRPESKIVKMREVNDILKSCDHEGYMVLGLDSYGEQTGKVIKMKSPYYLIRKMIARKQDLNAALVNAEKVKHHIEEELFCIVDAVRDNKDMVQAMDEQQRLKFMTDVLMGTV